MIRNCALKGFRFREKSATLFIFSELRKGHSEFIRGGELEPDTLG